MTSRQRKKSDAGYAWEHQERRWAVTLADFYHERLNAITIPWGSIDAARLMGAPIDMPRADARTLAPYSQKVLDRKTKPLLSASPEYASHAPGWAPPGSKPPGRNWFGMTAAERRHLLRFEKATGYFVNREEP